MNRRGHSHLAGLAPPEAPHPRGEHAGGHAEERPAMVLEKADRVPAPERDPPVTPLRPHGRGTARRFLEVRDPARRVQPRRQIRHEARRLEPGGRLARAGHRIGGDAGHGRKALRRIVHRTCERLAQLAAASFAAFRIEQVHQAGPQAGAADERERASHASPPVSCSQR
jgi:hypothetical protein